MARSRNRAQRTQEEIDNDASVRWDRLCYEEEKRQQNLARFQLTAPRNVSDDEGGALCPKYDRILRVQGADRVLRMCNFSPAEFERLWDVLEDHVLAHWNVGRGKKSIHSPKDILFMTIGALKHCGNWDVVSSMFEIDPSPFQKMVRKFLSMLEPFLYDTFVVGEERRWKMKKLTLSGHSFKTFPSARYATDVTFQQSNRPTGGYSNAKKYFSGKHHLYGYKVEVSVLPTGAAINSTNFEPGAVADVTMFRDNGAFHRSAMRKLPDEADLSDDGPLSAAYRNDWGVLTDKGYQGLADEYRAIHPKKKARGAPPLTLDELQNNDKIAHDRVIVENLFGRLKTLWGVCSHKWEWDDKSYNMFFRACVALTNYSVRCCPLRREDGECFLRYEARLIQIGLEIEAEKKRKRQEYRDGRRARLELTARDGTRRRLSLGRSQNASPCSTIYGSP